jgi:hypothetical protein
LPSRITGPYGEIMVFKVRPKISWQSRRIRLGVAHHGSPSAWAAPVKDQAAERTKPHKKRR